MAYKPLHKNKLPSITIDDSLAKYKDMHLFQHKVDEAIETLNRVGLPKEKNHIPELTIDKSLNKYKGKVLFPEKLAKAKERSKNVDLSKVEEPIGEYKKSKKSRPNQVK
jgi:hypothetical protein